MLPCMIGIPSVMGGFRENAAGYIGRMTREALAIGGTITFTEEKGREIHIGALHYQALFRREQEESRCPFFNFLRQRQ